MGVTIVSSTFPPGGPQEPEYLEQGGGAPYRGDDRPRTGRRTAVLAGAAVAGLALVGGGVWAAVSFFGTGPQPAEALPASTLGYASIDLDPSGGQKIEAVRMLNKFPEFEDELGLDTDDDVREKIFEELELGESCDGLDYGDDIEPWLGDRAAVAAVDLGEDQPAPVVVVQVKDEDKADDGLATLQDCGDGETLGWAIDDGWAVLAETDDIAQDVADETADGSLADDGDYQQWMDEVGDAGIVTMYAAPEAGQFLADTVEDFMGFGMNAEMPAEMLSDEGSVEGGMPSDTEFTDDLREDLENFSGLAVTLRFDDGAVELEMAGDAAVTSRGIPTTEAGDDVLSTLPEDTAAAIGVGFADGWFGKVLDQMATMSGGMSVEELVAEAKAETGLDLPEDAETLAGDSATLALGSDFDPEAFVNSTDGTDVPVGLKVQGDPDAIEDVLAKLQEKIAADGGPELLTESDGDVIAIGLNADYVSTLVEDGDLGDSDVFEDVVREADDASAILFVNFDAGDGWLAEAVGDDPTVQENVEPLQGLGMSAWQDDDVAHAVLRLTTD